MGFYTRHILTATKPIKPLGYAFIALWFWLLNIPTISITLQHLKKSFTLSCFKVQFHKELVFLDAQLKYCKTDRVDLQNIHFYFCITYQEKKNEDAAVSWGQRVYCKAFTLIEPFLCYIFTQCTDGLKQRKQITFYFQCS